ncbi:MAG: Rieske 2Fe-2S domain-containing protein [Burkholderiales bacterium]|nr:Rieske 2Fe-2S domain-containing protein [Burkholderiales bacterium]
MERRDFIKACAFTCVSASVPAFAQGTAAPRTYARTLLVDETGKPIRSRSLPANRNFIFHYPYAATPCFLVNLGRPVKPAGPLKTADARTYDWPGGVGAAGSVVAYSAICAHKLTYPTRDISFIAYRGEATPTSKHAQVIHCCSEHSQYDAGGGGRVLAGPAPQPLAAILLEYEPASDGLYAVGTLGGEMFNEFFQKFEFRLAMEHAGGARAPVTGQTVVRELGEYCRQQVRC